MSTPNAKGLAWWDADSVPWSTVTVNGSFNKTIVVNDQIGMVGDPCSYSIRQTTTANFSQMDAFTREDPKFDADQTDNSFAVWRNADSVYSYLKGGGSGGGFGNATFTGATFTISTRVVTTYTRTGPATGCDPLPDDTDETTDVDTALVIQLAIADDQATFSGYGFSETPVIDSDFVQPVTLTVFDLKNSGSVDFGGTQTAHADNPDPSIYTTWDVTSSFSITCS